MARSEHDREDILREATALVERVELGLDGEQESLVVGFREQSGPAFFFGPDPVYQFNSDSELRRAYRDGLLLKAENGNLVELRRERHGSSLRLMRRTLTAVELAETLDLLEKRLEALARTLDQQNYAVVGQVPEDVDLVGRVFAWLRKRPPRLVVADRPHA